MFVLAAMTITLHDVLVTPVTWELVAHPAGGGGGGGRGRMGCLKEEIKPVISDDENNHTSELWEKKTCVLPVVERM